jgi:hypothetical protein
VVVPFFGDQPFWGQVSLHYANDEYELTLLKMIAKAGAGPEPIPFKQMTANSLAQSINFALKPEVKLAVAKMATSIAEEDGSEDTVRDFEHKLDIDKMRCHICPERLAIWRDKQTGAHLSGLAVCVLIKERLVNARHLRL